jgi:hypothetical protein
LITNTAYDLCQFLVGLSTFSREQNFTKNMLTFHRALLINAAAHLQYQSFKIISELPEKRDGPQS